MHLIFVVVVVVILVVSLLTALEFGPLSHPDLLKNLKANV